MDSRARDLAERLRTAGADHEQFLRFGPDAAKAAAGADEARAIRILERIADLSAQLHADGLPAWSTLDYGVAHLARAFPGDPDSCEAMLAELTGLARALKNAKLDDLAMQRLPATIHAAAGKPWLAQAGLVLARQLAEAGGDPGEMLRQAFPAIAAVAGSDEARFAPVGTALLESFAAMSAHGVSPTYPIARGVVALAEAYSDEPATLANAIRELAELAIVLRDRGRVPHPVIEYGITAALEQSSGEPWLRDEVFPLAFAMASEEDAGEPVLALQRIGALRGLDPPRGRALAARLRALAEHGMDPGLPLAAITALRHVADADLARFDVLVDATIAVVEAVHAAKLRPVMAFDEGIPHCLSTPAGAAIAERVLAFARDLAKGGIEPGPVLLHGLSPALADLAAVFGDGAPPLAPVVLGAAEALLAAKVDPWRMLTPGVYAATRISRADGAAFTAVLGEIRDLALELARAGVDPSHIVGYGVRGLAVSIGGEPGARAVFTATLASLRAYAPGLSAAGIDGASATDGLAAAARLSQTANAPWLVPGAADLGRRFAAAGVDPNGILSYALPVMVKALGAEQSALEPLFAEIVSAATAQNAKVKERAARIDQVVVAAVAAASPDPAAVLRSALRLLRAAAEGGADASALAVAVVPVAAALDAPVRDAILDAAARFVLRGELVFGDAAASAAADAAAVSAGDPAAFERLLGEIAASASLVREAADTREAEADPGSLLRHGATLARALADAAPEKRPEVFAASLRRFATRIAAARRAGHDLAPVLARASVRIAGEAARPDAFFDALEVMIRAGGPRGADDDALGALLLEHAVPMAITAADGDAGEVVRGLEELARLRAASNLGEEARYVLPWLGRFSSAVRAVPSLFRDVLVPVLRSPAGVAATALRDLERLTRWITDDDAVSVLKHVVTQEGVRGPEILSGLLLPGLESGSIVSLSGEREILIAFLRDVSIVDPGFYAAYRRIVTDPATTDAARRDAVRALEAGVAALAAAVVAGEVPADRHDDPMLGHVLFHVFPPAVSVTRDRYLELWRSRDDHPGHLAPYAKRDGLGEVRLPRGGYRLREGETVDLAPWETLRGAVVSVHESGSREEPLEALGNDLFDAWIEGEVGTPRARPAFLARIYRRHRETAKPLPDAPASAEELLRYREFLADTAREIVQEALRTVRASSPERYERLTRAKLCPPPHVGPGLVRAVWSAVESARVGKIDAATARERIGKQLRAFDLAGREEDILARADRDALEALLVTLPAKSRDVELGGEHVRVMQDLCGSELAAMQRELFGEGGKPGKLEYRRDAAAAGSVLRLEPTKRRAHVPIGFCEGVCTAVDEQLWNREAFAQVVFWGPDGRARGGMHLLLVEREGAAPALALPGINPSLDVLGESGAEAVLDALLAWAVGLARQNGIGAVWIPDHGGILSNRGPIHGALAERKLPVKSIPSTVFSYRPYGYSFDRVLVVWEA